MCLYISGFQYNVAIIIINIFTNQSKRSEMGYIAWPQIFDLPYTEASHLAYFSFNLDWLVTIWTVGYDKSYATWPPRLTFKSHGDLPFSLRTFWGKSFKNFVISSNIGTLLCYRCPISVLVLIKPSLSAIHNQALGMQIKLLGLPNSSYSPVQHH